MRSKRLLALLLAAALALSVLLTGCKGGGGESLAQVILNLLDGKYQNITVQLDPDLRQAVNEGETDEEIRAALEKLLGSGVNFRLIGDGQKGDSAWNLILYPGSDPDAAARSAYLEWDKIFSSFPASGLYTANLSMIETDNGYAILVKTTVDKAARRNDDDDEPDDEPEDEKIEGTGFTYNVTKNTITMEPDNEAGLQNLLTQQAGEDSQITAARNSGFAGVTIELAAGSYSVSSTFGGKDTPFMGTLKGESPDKKATITLTGGNGLFAQIGVYNSGPENNGKVENITFDVETTITGTHSNSGSNCAGAVASMNYGEITGCHVTIEANGKISAQRSSSNTASAGGLVGDNDGTITDCTVTIGGSIQATGTDTGAEAGGIAGYNYGKITGNSQVTIEIGGSIIATSDKATAYAGGLVGCDFFGDVTGAYSFSSKNDRTITARAGKIDENTYTDNASVPGAEDNDSDGNSNTDTVGNASAGTKWGGDAYNKPAAHEPPAPDPAP